MLLITIKAAQICGLIVQQLFTVNAARKRFFSFGTRMCFKKFRGKILALLFSANLSHFKALD